MKNALPFLLLILLLSCHKKNQETISQTDAQENVAPYDTAAIDSFSAGATPRNVILTRKDSIVRKTDSAKLTKTPDEKSKTNTEKEKEKLLKTEKDKTEAKKKGEKNKEKTQEKPKDAAPKPEAPKSESAPAEQPK